MSSAIAPVADLLEAVKRMGDILSPVVSNIVSSNIVRHGCSAYTARKTVDTRRMARLRHALGACVKA